MEKRINLIKNIANIEIENKSYTFPIVDLPEEFINWNLKRRLEDINGIEKGKMPSLHGPHNAAVATCGAIRQDSLLPINNAYKGMGFVPKEKYIKSVLNELNVNKEKPMKERLNYLKNLYKNPHLFNKKLLVSLELYTFKDFKTHTYLNIMKNPIASIVFLDKVSYEIKSVVDIVFPDDKTNRYKKEILNYTNAIHSFFHGTFKRIFPVLIFYTIEAFNNTPGSKKGIKIE